MDAFGRWRTLAALVAAAALGCGRVSFETIAIDRSDGAVSDAAPADGSAPSLDGARADAPELDASTPEDAGCAPMLADGFDDGVRDPAWVEWYENPPTTLAEVGGQLVITPAAGFAGSAHSGYQLGPRDLTGRIVQVRVDEVPNASTAAQALFHLLTPDEAYSFLVESGQLRVGTRSTVNATRFDATGHRFWRFDASGGRLAFHTSPDGVTWSERTSVAAPDLTAARVGLSGGTWREETMPPGTVRFDEFAIGCP